MQKAYELNSKLVTFIVIAFIYDFNLSDEYIQNSQSIVGTTLRKHGKTKPNRFM